MLYIDQLTDLLTKIDNTDNLELIADTLQRYFHLLVAAVKNALISKSVSLDDVKIVINDTLTCIICIKEEQWIKEYQQKLEGIRDMSSLFKEYLLKYCFIGYLNYVISKSADMCVSIRYSSIHSSIYYFIHPLCSYLAGGYF